jgi:hypothetical protein
MAYCLLQIVEMHPTLTSTRLQSDFVMSTGRAAVAHCLDVKPAPTVAAPEAGPVVCLSIPVVIAMIVVLTTHVTVVMIAIMITMATIVALMT